MKRLYYLPILLIISCSGPSANVTGISEDSGETYFTINGSGAEFMGVFGQAKNPLLWSVSTRDITAIEQLVRNAARSRVTNQYDPDKKAAVKVDLTDQESGVLRDITSKTYYRVYTAGTNGKRDKIMEVLYYPSKDAATIVADIIVNISTASVQIR